jgi:type IV secretory pathway VirB4 component
MTQQGTTSTREIQQKNAEIERLKAKASESEKKAEEMEKKAEETTKEAVRLQEDLREMTAELGDERRRREATEAANGELIEDVIRAASMRPVSDVMSTGRKTDVAKQDDLAH